MLLHIIILMSYWFTSQILLVQQLQSNHLKSKKVVLMLYL